MAVKPTIAIIDYGMGNLSSVAKALDKLGAAPVVTSVPDVIAAADKIVLPGVGAFGDCMKNLNKYGLIDVIHQVIRSRKPFLGICLGLQLLFESSEEDPGISGLAVFPGRVKKIAALGLKIPHMGWNSLEFSNPSPLFRNMSDAPYVYFVHSYHAVPDDLALVGAYTVYGEQVTAAVGQGNVQAVQFHPEKSGSVGMRIIANFIDG